MTVKLREFAFRAELPSIPKIILVALAYNIDERVNGERYLYLNEIADKCSISKRTAIKHLRVLKQKGLVTVERTTGQPLRYFLDEEALKRFAADNQQTESYQQDAINPYCRWFPFIPQFLATTGSPNAALLLSYVYSMRDIRGPLPRDMISRATGLSHKQQRAAERLLTEFGLLSVSRKGVPPKNVYEINMDAIHLILKGE